MQPDRTPSEWQQPKEQPSQAPYAPTPLENPAPAAPTPVVTLTPDSPDTLPMRSPSPQEEADGAQSPEHPVSDKRPSESSQEMQPIHWQAQEYIHHEKGFGWFFAFSAVSLVLIAFAVFVIQSLTFAILVPVMAAALVVYSHRPPRILDYTLSRQGLHVNDHLYSFAEFKSFGVIHDGKEYSVMLVPTKRFRAGVTVYFPEEAGEAIVDLLGARLPMQELHLDIVDRIIRKLRI